MGRPRTPLSPRERALGERMRHIAQGQGGVVTAGQCHELGASDSDIRRLMGSGEWRRVRRGVYAESRPGSDGHLRACGAVLAGLTAGTGAVSHASAARLLGLPLPPRVDSRVSITRRPPAPSSGPRSCSAAPLTVHLADYDDADLRFVDGVPVLAGARLVLDCCDAMPPDSALAVADAALTRGLTGPGQLRAQLSRRRGRPGSRVAGLVVARAAAGPESWFESMSRWWLLEAGLPRPELQVRFPTGTSDRDPAVDMWFAGQRTVGEADGAGKYDEPGSLFREKLREDWLRDTYGVEVVRWVPREMRTPARRAMVAARFHRAFARSRRTA